MKNLYNIFLLLFLTSCGTYFNQPMTPNNARLGESTLTMNSVIKEFTPKDKIVVGVYKFRDQTGQYKPAENGSTFSTAVTQGGTSILLKALDESDWFIPVERENIANLLNERQIIRSTRQEYQGNQSRKMPPLLFAGIILEGGLVSYDSNVVTGGNGVRYFGVGASNQYRQDRITVYLRAVSTSNGKILKNVYVSKTILSQSLSANLYRYVSLRRLLEVESGVTKTEPMQLAVKEAIDKAVEMLIIEGVADGLWVPAAGKTVVKVFKEALEKEEQIAENTTFYNRKHEKRRAKSSVSIMGGLSLIASDYSNPVYRSGFDVKYKYVFNNPRLMFGASLGRFAIENDQVFKETMLTTSLTLDYNFLPKDKVNPYAYFGVGSMMNENVSKTYFKLQYGAGLEYLLTNKIGVAAFGEYNQLFKDDLDELIRGSKNDGVWRMGIGLNFYF